MIRGLIEREASHIVLTDRGRVVLKVLMMKAATRDAPIEFLLPPVAAAPGIRSRFSTLS